MACPALGVVAPCPHARYIGSKYVNMPPPRLPSRDFAVTTGRGAVRHERISHSWHVFLCHARNTMAVEKNADSLTLRVCTYSSEWSYRRSLVHDPIPTKSSVSRRFASSPFFSLCPFVPRVSRADRYCDHKGETMQLLRRACLSGLGMLSGRQSSSSSSSSAALPAAPATAARR